ncbi:MAG: 50S ribosomal protein L5 [Dehalococcoidia bacterium]|nr:50S ribosomal protein L5 [Dehalococcoidia bacterium]
MAKKENPPIKATKAAASAKGAQAPPGGRTPKAGASGKARAPGTAPAAEARAPGRPRAEIPEAAKAPPSRLRERYRQEVAPALMKEFGYRNLFQVPKLEKVVLNVGLGEAIQNPKALEALTAELTAISGQKPVVTRAKKSIANFHLRAGMPIGAMVTLRGNRMYDFFDKLTNVALARIRDFRGVPRSACDGRGNYSLGIREQIVFPEVEYDKVDKVRSFQATIVTTARTDPEAQRLLELLGLPFSRA